MRLESGDALTRGRHEPGPARGPVAKPRRPLGNYSSQNRAGGGGMEISSSARGSQASVSHGGQGGLADPVSAGPRGVRSRRALRPGPAGPAPYEGQRQRAARQPLTRRRHRRETAPQAAGAGRQALRPPPPTQSSGFSGNLAAHDVHGFATHHRPHLGAARGAAARTWTRGINGGASSSDPAQVPGAASAHGSSSSSNSSGAPQQGPPARRSAAVAAPLVPSARATGTLAEPSSCRGAPARSEPKSSSTTSLRRSCAVTGNCHASALHAVPWPTAPSLPGGPGSATSLARRCAARARSVLPAAVQAKCTSSAAGARALSTRTLREATAGSSSPLGSSALAARPGSSQSVDASLAPLAPPTSRPSAGARSCSTGVRGTSANTSPATGSSASPRSPSPSQVSSSKGPSGSSANTSSSAGAMPPRGDIRHASLDASCAAGALRRRRSRL
mmetsp:Transcript_101289/g.275290  ORF Transcript_101289/g.275290 Transcript_101289/m.275290 type:complete len:446 (-) Transcript_101289:627-1964(-)